MEQIDVHISIERISIVVESHGRNGFCTVQFFSRIDELGRGVVVVAVSERGTRTVALIVSTEGIVSARSDSHRLLRETCCPRREHREQQYQE